MIVCEPKPIANNCLLGSEASVNIWFLKGNFCENQKRKLLGMFLKSVTP